MTIQPFLKQAGKYPVEWVPRPDFAYKHVDLSKPRAGILHTEEGSFDGSERVFEIHYAPHFVVGVHQGRPTIWQHVPIGIIGAACREHNNEAIVQIELEGSSKQTPWLPDAVHLDLLASLMLACRDAYGIPLSHPWKDGDYGKAGANAHRISGKFGTVAGWFGHGDMPPNDSHWDPGNLEWSKVFAHAEALSFSNSPRPAPGSLPPTRMIPVAAVEETVEAFISRMLTHGVSNLSGDDGYTLLKLAEAGGAAIGWDQPAPKFTGPDDSRPAPS